MVENTKKIRKANIWLLLIWRFASVIVLLLWGCLIFGFSAQQAEESSRLSEKVSYAIADEYNTIFRQEMSEPEVIRFADVLELPVRKIAHMTEYAVLALLLFNLLCAYAMKGTKRYFVAVLIVFLYACTDELHQLFVSGRAGRFVDVLIDTIGGIIMMLVTAFVIRLARRMKRHFCRNGLYRKQ